MWDQRPKVKIMPSRNEGVRSLASCDLTHGSFVELPNEPDPNTHHALLRPFSLIRVFCKPSGASKSRYSVCFIIPFKGPLHDASA